MPIPTNIDILLINTGSNTSSEIHQLYPMPPLGLLYLASSLKETGFSVRISDFAVEKISRQEFQNRLIEWNPKLVGLGTYFSEFSKTRTLAKIIKETLPDTKVLAGGNAATFGAEKYLKETSIDYVIRGEADHIFPAFCNSLFQNQGDIEKTPGLSFRKQGSILHNPQPQRIRDLDSLPFPARELIDLSSYSYPITISTARGCNGDCIFCSSKAYWGNKITFRSSENILDEIQHIYKTLGYKTFFIIDDTFTFKKSRTCEFCRLLKETGIPFTWGCESRADVASEELLETLYDAGCRKIQFGLESASNDILRQLGKKVTREQVEKAALMAASMGMDVNISFILGHAFDTQETMEETIGFAVALKKQYRNINPIPSINTPFPGTHQRSHMEQLGIQLLSQNWDDLRSDTPVIQTRYLTADQLRNAYAQAWRSLA